MPEDSGDRQLEQAQQFVEQYIDLLAQGEIDQSQLFLLSDLAGETDQSMVNRFAERIQESGIIEKEFIRSFRQTHSDGDRVVLAYNLRCEDNDQTLVLSVMQKNQELGIDGVAIRDHLGRLTLKGSVSHEDFFRSIASEGGRSPRYARGLILKALFKSYIIGTVLSAACLWVGMKVTRVDGTLITVLGIAAISKLVVIVPLFIVPIPCIWQLVSLVLLLALICRWTDASLFWDAIGMALVADVVSILASMALNFF